MLLSFHSSLSSLCSHITIWWYGHICDPYGTSNLFPYSSSYIHYRGFITNSWSLPQCDTHYIGFILNRRWGRHFARTRSRDQMQLVWVSAHGSASGPTALLLPRPGSAFGAPGPLPEHPRGPGPGEHQSGSPALLSRPCYRLPALWFLRKRSQVREMQYHYHQPTAFYYLRVPPYAISCVSCVVWPQIECFFH